MDVWKLVLAVSRSTRAVKIILERAPEAFVQPLVVGAGVAHVDVGRLRRTARDVVLPPRKSDLKSLEASSSMAGGVVGR